MRKSRILLTKQGKTDIIYTGDLWGRKKKTTRCHSCFSAPGGGGEAGREKDGKKGRKTPEFLYGKA